MVAGLGWPECEALHIFLRFFGSKVIYYCSKSTASLAMRHHN